jgi:hypothetical protein
MTKFRFGGLIGLACALLVPCGHAQLSSSPSFKLTDYVLDAGGGGSASSNFAAWMSIGSPSKGQLTSPRFAAGIGILETSDPQPTNGPVIFGITQPFGPKAGGNLVSISGLNFDKFGNGPTVTVDIGGNAATGVNVSSNTQLTATAPAGAKGPQDLTVTSSFGSNTAVGGYVYTPAVTATPFSVQGGTVELKNYGTVGQVFNTYISTATTSANTNYGTLLIGPFPLVQVLGSVPYFGPDGVTDIVFGVPHNPVLVGLTVYYQSLDITGVGPLTGELTNRASTTFP